MTPSGERRYVRVEHLVDLDYTLDGADFRARISDLSEGGAFIDTTFPQAVGSELEARFQLPDDPEPFECRARVAWAQPMLGMGIQFLDLSPADVDRLRFFVGSVFFGGGAPESDSDG